MKTFISGSKFSHGVVIREGTVRAIGPLEGTEQLIFTSLRTVICMCVLCFSQHSARQPGCCFGVVNVLFKRRKVLWLPSNNTNMVLYVQRIGGVRQSSEAGGLAQYQSKQYILSVYDAGANLWLVVWDNLRRPMVSTLFSQYRSQQDIVSLWWRPQSMDWIKRFFRTICYGSHDDRHNTQQRLKQCFQSIYYEYMYIDYYRELLWDSTNDKCLILVNRDAELCTRHDQWIWCQPREHAKWNCQDSLNVYPVPCGTILFVCTLLHPFFSIPWVLFRTLTSSQKKRFTNPFLWYWTPSGMLKGDCGAGNE